MPRKRTVTISTLVVAALACASIATARDDFPALLDELRETAGSSAQLPDATASPDPSVDVEEVRALLDELEVKGRAPKAGYDRDLFGPAWADTDRNGCDTRNDVLRRDLTAVTFKQGTNGCVVLSGTLQDPYTGQSINFERGQDTSSAVQIDHVVALADAWQKGAQKWSAETREQFANDPLNLRAVDGPTNQQKGAGDAATWLPPAKGYRCEYVAAQVAVKSAYGLWVTAAEADAIERVLEGC
ncbi:HNH endonuclease family protein [Cellulosimicrobium sp. AB352]|uniref:HNH endonuclease family protein n=1 Tax=Cellulosimicrobium sp. AB352 TaxID=3413281 RepID=UPI003C28A112